MMEKEKLSNMVRGLQNGEDDAAMQLYATFQSDIYYFILKTVNNDRELAEDLTQDTFIEILETIQRLQEPAAFVTWSKQIAYHKCTAYFKKRKELLADEDEDGYSVFDTVEEEREEFIPDAALDKEDLKQTILSMINDLPEEQRSAIVLRYFNEISVKEIAQVQGVTEGTVKSRLNYGRKSIKQSVEEYEKKNGIKLRCVGILPLLLWLFREYRDGKGLSITAKAAFQEFFVTAETTVVTGVASAVTTTAASGAVDAATAAKSAVGVGMKATGKVLVTKIVVGIVAATVAIGGVTVGAAVLSARNNKPSYEETQKTESVESRILETTSATEEITVPTETTQQLTEETTVPAEETQEENATVAPNEAECDHIWQDYEYENAGFRKCEMCGRTEAIHDVLDSCEHNWECNTYVYPSVIEEERYCYICGHLEQYSYPNTCSHEWKESSWNDGDMMYIHRTCTTCGAVNRTSEAITPTEATTNDAECEHEWTYNDPIYTATEIQQIRVCTKCGLPEVASITENLCQHETTHSYYADENKIVESDNCTICGANISYSERENTCQHIWEEQNMLDENGNILQTSYYCPSCTATK